MLGSVHLFDWDEINFAESAREMLMTKDFFRVQINYEPFWEKPPLFFWLQCISMKIIGINEYAARLPNAITGIATLAILYRIGRKIINEKYALLWVMAYAGSFLPHFYFKTGIIDPLFNLFIFLGLYNFYLSYEKEVLKEKIFKSIYGGVFIGLAILTKGPVALLVSSLCILIFTAARKDFKPSALGRIALFGILSLLVAGIWFGLETWKNGSWFVQSFIQYNIRLFNTEDSGHGQPFYYHPVVLFIGCFPASIFCLFSLGKVKIQGRKEESFAFMMQILFWVVLLIFSISKTKIVHYSSLCYFPITFLAVYTIYRWDKLQKKPSNPTLLTIVVLGITISILLTMLPIAITYKDRLFPYIKDAFVKANLQADVYWVGFEFLIGFIVMAGIICTIIFRKNAYKMSAILYITVCVVLQMIFYIIIPKVEQYVQGSMIDFFKSIQNENCYVKAIGFKSYAQYYYTLRKPNYNKKAEEEDWLIAGKIDKPVYLITKLKRDQFSSLPAFQIVMDKNGFVVYKRQVDITP